ncbi:MAG: hypothetical protein WEF50_13870 [Myxococcota bacterium]
MGIRVAARSWVAPCALAALCLLAADARALGTPAGTPVTNTATVTYDAGAGTWTQSASAVFTVDERIDVVVTWLDAAPVAVAPADLDRQLTFQLTNTGNGSEAFALAVDALVAGDQFDPGNARVYLDSNDSGVYEPAVDPPYQPGVNDPLLGADGARLVFVLADIPVATLSGDRGDAELEATSLTGAVTGTIVAGAGELGTDAVIGGGTSAVLGSYLVSDEFVSVAKTAVVTDLGGGSTPAPGSTITYSLVVTPNGAGTFSNLVITDALPPFTTWVAGSLTLDAVPLSDVVDGDAGDFGGTIANQVTVALGNLAGGSLPQTITFAVTID